NSTISRPIRQKRRTSLSNTRTSSPDSTRLTRNGGARYCLDSRMKMQSDRRSIPLRRFTGNNSAAARTKRCSSRWTRTWPTAVKTADLPAQAPNKRTKIEIQPGTMQPHSAVPKRNPAWRAGLSFVTALTLGWVISDSRADDLGKRSAPNIVYLLCDDLGYGDVKCL